jgi:hypothetical protein
MQNKYFVDWAAEGEKHRLGKFPKDTVTFVNKLIEGASGTVILKFLWDTDKDPEFYVKFQSTLTDKRTGRDKKVDRFALKAVLVEGMQGTLTYTPIVVGFSPTLFDQFIAAATGLKDVDGINILAPEGPLLPLYKQTKSNGFPEYSLHSSRREADCSEYLAAFEHSLAEAVQKTLDNFEKKSVPQQPTKTFPPQREGLEELFDE